MVLAQGERYHHTILPGSRRGEIAHHVSGSWWKALAEVRQKLPRFPEIVVAVAPETGCLSAGSQIPLRLAGAPFLKDDTYNALASRGLGHRGPVGTATVETALLDKPMIVVYRLSSPLTARLAKNRW